MPLTTALVSPILPIAGTTGSFVCSDCYFSGAIISCRDDHVWEKSGFATFSCLSNEKLKSSIMLEETTGGDIYVYVVVVCDHFLCTLYLALVRLPIIPTPMAERGGKTGKTSLGGAPGAKFAGPGDDDSDGSQEEEEESMDEMDTDEGESESDESGSPTIAATPESISQATRHATNNARRAGLKLVVAEYRATEDKGKLDEASRSAAFERARMGAFEVMEASIRNSAAIAAAAAAPKARQEASNAPGAAASAAAARPAIRVRTGRPGRQGRKHVPGDGAVPAAKGFRGAWESGRQNAATKPGRCCG